MVSRRGSEAGVARHVFSIYGSLPFQPTPRHVVGELTVVAVRDRRP